MARVDHLLVEGKTKVESPPMFYYMQSDPLHPSVKKVPLAAEVRNCS